MILSKGGAVFERPLVDTLVARLGGSRGLIQALVGPRQSGKTTAVLQAQARLEAQGVRVLYAPGDEPLIPGPAWIDQQWEVARSLSGGAPVVLVLDEVHKIPGWSERVKAGWDRDTREKHDVRVVVLGSSPLPVRRRLEESLAGRFETIASPHWSFAECREAFGWDLDTYVFFGGYPGSASLIDDFPRWRRYVLDSLVETTARDGSSWPLERSWRAAGLTWRVRRVERGEQLVGLVHGQGRAARLIVCQI